MENYFNCIYCYTNKINGKKYVGQTADFLKRYKEHINDSYNMNKKYGYNLPFHCAIRKYGIENFEIEILKENLKDYEEMDYWERYYIKEFDLLAKNGKGYNLSDGGYGGNKFAGKIEEEMQEIGKRISAAKKGKNRSEETKAKISEANKGKHKKGESKNNGSNHPKAKRVIQFDITTKTIIKVWNYAKEISDNLDIKYVTLKYYLQGRAKTHEYAGYLWYYEDDFNELNLDST